MHRLLTQIQNYKPNHFERVQPILKPVHLHYLKFTRTRQQAVLMLQHCAILSQLNHHQDALEISKATAILISQITNLAQSIMQLKYSNRQEVARWKQEQHHLARLDFIITRARDMALQSFKQTHEKQSITCKSTGKREGEIQGEKRERRGRSRRKPSASGQSDNIYAGSLNFDVRSKCGRSVSQHSIGLVSKMTMMNDKKTKSIAGLSRCSSKASQKSTKSVQQINASFERVHTFSMSFFHKKIKESEEAKGNLSKNEET
jgi:hypothetical protein